jgi:hypothetical protein
MTAFSNGKALFYGGQADSFYLKNSRKDFIPCFPFHANKIYAYSDYVMGLSVLIPNCSIWSSHRLNSASFQSSPRYYEKLK